MSLFCLCLTGPRPCWCAKTGQKQLALFRGKWRKCCMYEKPALWGPLASPPHRLDYHFEMWEMWGRGAPSENDVSSPGLCVPLLVSARDWSPVAATGSTRHCPIEAQQGLRRDLNGWSNKDDNQKSNSSISMDGALVWAVNGGLQVFKNG